MRAQGTRFCAGLVGALLGTGALGCGGEPMDPKALASDRDAVETVVMTQAVDLQTAHPYANHADQSWSVEVPAEALSLRVVFERFETEAGYDFVEIRDGQGTRVHRLSGVLSGGSYAVEGNRASLRFTADGSVGAWGFAVTRVEYDLPLPEEASDHRPVCRNIGTRSEGWYWGDTDQLIKWERCAAMPAPECVAIGSRSEGWSSGGALITWDLCHRTVRVAVAGESCGPSIGFRCHDGLWCQGVPADTLGGSGTCLDLGACLDVDDCVDPSNLWDHPRCIGQALCEQGRCAWQCTAPEGPRHGWVGVLVEGLESEHPYANDQDQTWTKSWQGALRVQLHFQQIDVEALWDSLAVGEGTPEREVVYDGQHEDLWSQELEGGTAVLRLRSDYSVAGYGFRVDMARLYLEVPEGACSEDAHCPAGERCQPHSCFNPYAPCFGSCAAAFPGGDFESTQAAGIPDHSASGVRSEIVTQGMDSQCAMALTVDVDVRHTYVGDLVVGLTGPDGARVVLHDRAGGGADDLHLAGVPVAFTGDPNGTWTLDASDHASYDVGTLERWALHFACR